MVLIPLSLPDDIAFGIRIILNILKYILILKNSAITIANAWNTNPKNNKLYKV